MKQVHPNVEHSSVSCLQVQPHENPVLRTIIVIVPDSFVQSIYQQALVCRYKQSNPYGLAQKEPSIKYIEQVYQTNILEQVHEFLFQYFVTNILHQELREQHIVIAGTPRLTNIYKNQSNNTIFEFTAMVFPEIHIHEWKYFCFKAPRRKRYKDLDRQVEFFIKEEEENQKNYVNDTVGLEDFVNFDVTLTDEHCHFLGNYSLNLWLKIGTEEADTISHELFLGKHIGDVINTNNEGLQEFFNQQNYGNFNFCVTIKDIVPHAFVDLEQIKKQFRLKSNRELHQKLIEVFSYRNDISQRKAMVHETCKLMLEKHPFTAPHFLLLRQEEKILQAIQNNPDYLVYKMQKDFKQTVEKLAEQQVKEAILIDIIAFHERMEITHQDVKNYLNLMKRQRTREFLHFRIPETKTCGQELPISTQELMQTCLREKTLNYIIYNFTKR